MGKILTRYHTFYCLFFCCFAFLVLAAKTPYGITHYGHEQGLPQVTIRDMQQDAKGLIWIGTETGLVRFDGFRFKKIKAPLGRTVVSELQVDHNNRIWVMWVGPQLDIYDPATGQWLHVAAQHDAKIFGFNYLDEKFWLEIRTPTRLEYLDKNYQHHILEHPVFNKMTQAGKQPINIKHYQFHENRLILTGFDQWYMLDLQTTQFQAFTSGKTAYARSVFAHNNTTYYCSTDGLGVLNMDDPSVKPLLLHPQGSGGECLQQGNTLLQPVSRTTEFALVALNLDEHSYTKRFPVKDYPQLQDSTELSLIRFDSKLWLVSENGLFEINNDELIQHFSTADFEINIAATLVAWDNTLWLGTENHGIYKISPKSARFNTLKSEALPTLHFRKAVQVDDDIWFGMNTNGVAKHNRQTAQWKHFPLPEVSKTQVRALSKDDAGHVYAGTASGEVIQFNPQDDRYQVIWQNQPPSIINTLLYVEPYLWIGGSQKIRRLEVKNRRSDEFLVQESPIFGYQIKAMAEANDGGIFIGSHSGGVSKINQQGITLKTWLPRSNYIFSVYQDEYDYLWVGTWGAGLVRIQPKTDEMQFYNDQNVLNDNTIFGILPGQKGELWLSHYNGLTQFKGCVTSDWDCQPTVRHFNQHDGLQGKEFDAEAFALLDSGELYFGGSGGANVFYPQDFPKNQHQPPMLITDLQINNQNIYGYDTKKMELPHDYGQLSIDFAAMDYQAPEANRYQYRTSSGSNWIDLREPHLALNQLQPGRHHIEIRGSNNDGIWTKNPLKLNIKVKPPWYNSWVAWCTYILMFLIVISFWIKTLRTLVKKRTRELVLALRHNEQTLANVSHELKTPLTTILGPAKELLTTGLDKQQKIQAQLIDKSSQRLKNMIEKLLLLETVRHRQHKIPELVAIVDSIKPLLPVWRSQASHQHMNIHLHSEPDIAVYCDGDDLVQIIDNLVTNGIKYAGEQTTIEINSELTGENVQISIKDDGMGMAEEEQQRLFDRFYRGKTAAGITGSGLGMSLVKAMVENNQGYITVNSEPGQGTEFTVSFKGKQKTLTPAKTAPPETLRIQQKYHSRIRVLVIDDEPDVRLWLQNALSAEFTVFTASDGKAGLIKAAEHELDLILLDLMLPDIDGQHVLEQIKADSKLSSIPIIMMSAYSKRDSRLKGLKAHATDFIAKPFDTEELMLKIKNLMTIKTQIQQTTRSTLEPNITTVKDTQSNDFGQQLKTQLINSYHDPAFNNQKLAVLMDMPESKLNKQIKKLAGMTTKEYITWFRVQQAKKLLAIGVATTEVCYASGFNSSSAYYRAFKNHTNTTPKKYQKQHLKTC